MCLAVPAKITKIEGDWATVKAQGHLHKANLSLLKKAKVGDYVLVHMDLAINAVDKEDAERIIKAVRKLKLKKK